MAIRNIVKEDDPILLKVSRIVENFDERLHQLLEDMAETLKDANGVGLAAPQVGVMRQICIVQPEIDGEIIELINPEIISEEGEQDGFEGCLSCPGEYGMVLRPMKVTVKAQNRRGEWFERTGEGLEARAFCHEVDHLHGIIFKTKASRMLTQEELNSDNKQTEDED